MGYDLSQRADTLLRTANGIPFPNKKLALVIGTNQQVHLISC